MKPYFAKHLLSLQVMEDEKKPHSYFGDAGPTPLLCLCSRDIKVGDKVWNQLSGYGIVILRNDEEKDFVVKYGLQDYEVSEDLENVIKVIGEISPEATWVREGDEFDEEQVNIYQEATEDGDFKVFDVQIKGPCGRFH